jgi:hypothetical protein
MWRWNRANSVTLYLALYSDIVDHNLRHASWKSGPCSLFKHWTFNSYRNYLIGVTIIVKIIQTHFNKYEVCWGPYLMALPCQQQQATLLNFRAKTMASFYFRWSKLSVQAHKGTSSANKAIKPLLKYKNLLWLIHLSQKRNNTIWKRLENSNTSWWPIL